jgi:hypothetical protein
MEARRFSQKAEHLTTTRCRNPTKGHKRVKVKVRRIIPLLKHAILAKYKNNCHKICKCHATGDPQRTFNLGRHLRANI